jgi:hypothetical protein
MNFLDLWVKGFDIQQYVDHMSKYQKEMKNRLRDVRITQSECQRLRTYMKIRKIFVLSDPGCTDCLMNIPILIKMVECSPNLEYRIFDKNLFPEFKSYLFSLNLSKVPVFYIMDEDFSPIDAWMERPKTAEKLINKWKKEHPDYDILKNSDLKDDDPKALIFKKLKSMYLDEMWNWYDTNLQSETIKEVLLSLN